MKTVHKLILKSYAGPMVLTFFIVLFVFIMQFMWRYIDELVGKGLGMDVILELMMYAAVTLIPMVLPLATLFAAVMTMGNMGENYELLAMKSSGMSLMRIMKPLIIVVGLISIGSFFVVNNLVPYANKKMTSIIYDIRRQKQVLEFQDGLFFNGIDDMSIRVGHQDPVSGLLYDVLIYDNRTANGNMTTTTAETGYIRLSDDKKYLLVTLYNGDNYQQTRNNQWYTRNELRHDTFDVQNAKIAMDGFDFQRSDNSGAIGGSQTKNIVELQRDIDSLDVTVTTTTAKSYEPLLKDNIFTRDIQVLQLPDSLRKDKTGYRDACLLDSIPTMTVRQKNDLWNSARAIALNSRNSFSFDETAAKEALNQLYRSKNDWHRKLSLPVSVLIFFLIGAPLGAIIRKGGLGTPIVISVVFFVVYYIISLSGEKMAKEGAWSSMLGMWISSIVLTPIAAYLLVKATNDSQLLDVDWYSGKLKVLKERSAPVLDRLKRYLPKRLFAKKIK